MIGGITFIAAFILAFIFTYLRSKKAGTPIWGISGPAGDDQCSYSDGCRRALPFRDDAGGKL